MKKVGIAIAITALFALIGVFTYAALNNSANVVKTAQSAPSTVSEQPKPPTRPELLKLVNAERKKYGAKPLVIDERLNKSAQRKSDEMYAENRYKHINKAGIHGYQYAKEAMPKCNIVSENYYYSNYDITADNAFDTWYQSKPHIAAIRDKMYQYTGFGITYKNGQLITVEHFCQI